MKHLSELSLEGTAIKGLPLSIEYLTGLVLLNLRNCQNLESLPSCIYKLRSLEILILSDCLKLKELPEVLENMGSLLELFLYGTAIKKLPSSIQHLSGLVLLNLRECKSLAILPHSIRKLKSLQTLILSGCSKLDNLPKGLGSLQGLEKLEAAGTAIKELPPSISLLENLEVLSFEGCKGLESNPRNSLPSFQLLPAEIGRSRGFQLHSFFGLRSLRKLNLSDCNILEGAIPNDFSSLCSLEYLDLSRNNFVTLPASLNQLSQLKGLRLGYCKRLQSLPELPSSIEEIDAPDCTVTENILCPSSVYRSKECGGLRFTFSNCFTV
ncbi:hypothetical protein VitviT2T_028639 [Vitis vinifera]|uniref:Disease resistance protein RPS4B/Roq1-like leucine-rich repeats domain-containing protein n=1 Tax=Vitis vinifera TaxID=29760 RepID=A0ABY9DVZ1_VITVI|nr:hypothetical protein VitviT2T_028639 [Vitis vinifera]